MVMPVMRGGGGSRVVLVAAVLLVGCLAVATGSRGDEEPAFQSCVTQCASTYCVEGGTRHMPLCAKMLLWSCEEDCSYECMHMVTDEKEARDEPIEQYYGKWPFTRVMGHQEILSVVFSIGNGIPHYLYRNQWKRHAPASHYMVNIGGLYSLLGINTWFWSAAFHSRDNWFTERLDYHCASLLVLYSFYMCLVRMFDLRKASQRTPLAVCLFGGLALHVLYMNLVEFDYGLNMILSVVVALANTICWVVFNVRRPRPHAWKIYVGYAIVWAGASCELGDFPPYFFRLVDAHAVWHASTIIPTFMYYQYWMSDLDFDMKMPSRRDE